MATTKRTTSTSAKSKTTSSAKNNSEVEEKVEKVNDAITVINNTEAVEEKSISSTAPVFTRKTEKYYPMDEVFMVRNATGGKLVYVSKRLTGYEETWYTFGEEIPMEMAELYSMKNTDRSFFTQNWIEVDPYVLKDLGMEKFYENAISIDEVEEIFEKSPNEIIKIVSEMKSSMKTAFALQAIQKVKDEELTNIVTINAIEKALGCSIYER